MRRCGKPRKGPVGEAVFLVAGSRAVLTRVLGIEEAVPQRLVVVLCLLITVVLGGDIEHLQRDVSFQAGENLDRVVVFGFPEINTVGRQDGVANEEFSTPPGWHVLQHLRDDDRDTMLQSTRDRDAEAFVLALGEADRAYVPHTLVPAHRLLLLLLPQLGGRPTASPRPRAAPAGADHRLVPVQVDLRFKLVPEAVVLVGVQVTPQQLDLLDPSGQFLVEILCSKLGPKHLAVQRHHVLAQGLVLLPQLRHLCLQLHLTPEVQPVHVHLLLQPLLDGRGVPRVSHLGRHLQLG
uniref:Uncharacterized protein n=1 Tax=Ixodes ricinus TaxID=34613 RepID=A0A6B0V9F6_IXORI